MKKLLSIVILLVAIHCPQFSFAEGGQVGNGGLGVSCDNGPLKVLDFYEAEEKFEIIDLSTFANRADFFAFMMKRIKLAKSEQLNSKIIHTIENRLLAFGELSTWKNTASILTHDAALSEDLPENCKLVQIAVYAKGKPRKIPEATSLLSLQQSWLLELHEVLYSTAFDDIKWGQYDSGPTRRFISYLLKKTVRPSLLSLEAKRFVEPKSNWKRFKLGTTYGVGMPINDLGETILSTMSSVYVLSNTEESDLEACPIKMAFLPSGGSGNHFYGIFHSPGKDQKKVSFALNPGVAKGRKYKTSAHVGGRIFNPNGIFFRFSRKANDGSESLSVRVEPHRWGYENYAFEWKAQVRKTDANGNTSLHKAVCDYYFEKYGHRNVRDFLREFQFN